MLKTINFKITMLQISNGGFDLSHPNLNIDFVNTLNDAALPMTQCCSFIIELEKFNHSVESYVEDAIIYSGPNSYLRRSSKTEQN